MRLGPVLFREVCHTIFFLIIIVIIISFICVFDRYPQWGTANAEIKVISVENPVLKKILHLKPGVGQNIATHASSTTRSIFLVFISAFWSIHLKKKI